MKNQIILICLVLLSQTMAFAYSSTLMNGEILKKDNFNIGAELQYITENDSGINLNGRFDIPLTEEMNLRAVAGFGEVTFHFGGYLKWIPIPDYDTQPAMGFLTGVHFAKLNDYSEFSLRVHPYMSKTFNFEIGSVAPYTALPIAFAVYDGETAIPVQFQLGTELKIKQLEHFSFLVELGVDVHKSFTYFSLGLNFHFDSNYGMMFN